MPNTTKNKRELYHYYLKQGNFPEQSATREQFENALKHSFSDIKFDEADERQLLCNPMSFGTGIRAPDGTKISNARYLQGRASAEDWAIVPRFHSMDLYGKVNAIELNRILMQRFRSAMGGGVSSVGACLAFLNRENQRNWYHISGASVCIFEKKVKSYPRDIEAIGGREAIERAREYLAEIPGVKIKTH